MWLKCIILLYAAYKTVSVNIPSDAKISSISREIIKGADKEKDVKVLTACYTLGTGVAENKVKHRYLFIGSKEGDNPHEQIFREYIDGTGVTPIGCSYFAGEIEEKYLGLVEPVTFLFEANGDDMLIPLSYSTAKFKLPATLLEADAVINTITVGADQKSLRIKYNLSVDLTGWQICNDADSATTPSCDDSTKVCYAIETGAVIAEYSLCMKDEDSKAIFKTATGITVTKVDAKGSNPTDVLLSYDPIKDGPAATLNINGYSATNTMEFVLYDAEALTKDIFGICQGVEKPCVLKYSRSKTTMKLITTDIKIDDNTALKSDTLDFEDYKLAGTHLGNNVIEMYWEKSDVAGDYYAASVAIAGGDANPLQKVVTDCSGEDPAPGPTYCFAYFVGTGVKGKEYFATIAPNTDGDDWDPKLTNQIKSEPIIPFPLKDSLVIHVETTATIITDRNTEVDVCFNHVANASTQGTQYEFLAVNSKGTWKKFLGEKKKDESHACFYALELLTADFNENSKFLVLLRDTTNGKVLASGEAELNLQALRAIKPEVDNGNNGSTSTMAIVGAAIAGIACLMALVAAAVMFVMKIKRDNDGLQYPLHRTNIEQDSSYIHGLDNPIPTM